MGGRENASRLLSPMASADSLQMIAPADVVGERLDELQRSWMINAGIWNHANNKPMGCCSIERRSDGTRLFIYLGPGPLLVRVRST